MELHHPFLLTVVAPECVAKKLRNMKDIARITAKGKEQNCVITLLFHDLKVC